MLGFLKYPKVGVLIMLSSIFMGFPKPSIFGLDFPGVQPPEKRRAGGRPWFVYTAMVLYIQM